MREKRRFLPTRRFANSNNRFLVIPPFLLVPLALALLTLTFILIGQVTGASKSGYGPLGTIRLLVYQINHKLLSVTQTRSRTKEIIVLNSAYGNATKAKNLVNNVTDNESFGPKDSVLNEILANVSASNTTDTVVSSIDAVSAGEKKESLKTLDERSTAKPIFKKDRSGERARVCYRHFMNNHEPGVPNVPEPPFPETEEQQKEYFKIASAVLQSMRIFPPGHASSSTSSTSKWKWPPDDLLEADEGLECSSKPFSLTEMEDHAERNYFSVLSLPGSVFKSRKELSEAVGLSRMLNRTFILPRVGHGHISLFYPGSYCAYFNNEAISNYVNWVTNEFYTEMVTCMELKLNVTYVCVLDSDANDPNHGNSSDVSRCLSMMRPEHLMSIMAFTGGNHPSVNNVMTVQVNDLHSFTISDDVDLILFLKFSDSSAFVESRDVSDSPLVEATKFVQYSPNLVAKANLVRSRLQPKFIATHFSFQRMYDHYQRHKLELNDAAMRRCVEQLIKSVERKMLDASIEQVYLASDLSTYENHTRDWFPWDRTWKSGGFQNPLLDVAKKSLIHIVQTTNAVVIEDLIQIPQDMDVGLIEIINHLVCVEADLFFTAPAECGGDSDFYSEVAESRKLSNKKDPIKWMLRNQG